MFLKSIYNPESITYNDESSLSATVKKSKTMQKEIKKQIKIANNIKKSKSITFREKSVFFSEKSSLADIDAKLSIGHAKYDITITEIDSKIGVNIYKANVHMYDVYDFDNKRDGRTISDYLNNFGLGLQNKGIVKKYNWDLDFILYFNEEELK